MKTTFKVLALLLAVLMSLLINNVILKNIVQRPRPFEEYEAMYRICELANYAPPTGYSMASGHASATMAVAVALFMFSKKWGAVAISASIVVGLTRVALLVHYMTDVLVGWAIGAALAIGVYYLFRYVYKKIQIKIQEKRGNYEKIEGEELNNFRRAAHLYLDLVKTKLYC